MFVKLQIKWKFKTKQLSIDVDKLMGGVWSVISLTQMSINVTAFVGQGGQSVFNDPFTDLKRHPWCVKRYFV